jgi:hypothetical protein
MVFEFLINDIKCYFLLKIVKLETLYLYIIIYYLVFKFNKNRNCKNRI